MLLALDFACRGLHCLKPVTSHAVMIDFGLCKGEQISCQLDEASFVKGIRLSVTLPSVWIEVLLLIGGGELGNRLWAFSFDWHEDI